MFEDGTDDENELKEIEMKLKTEMDAPSELPKKKNKKREMTKERKAALVENLKRGRITSALNRKKKKALKDIALKEKTDADDKKILDSISSRKTESSYKEEIKRLKAQLEGKVDIAEKKLGEKKPVKEVVFNEEEKEIEENKPKFDPPLLPKKRRACGVTGLNFLRSLN